MTTPNRPGEEVEEWIWTSDVVLGWCDSAGCESIGHKGNNCRLANSFAAHLRRSSPVDGLREALEESRDLLDDLDDLPLERVSVERLEGVWNKVNSALNALTPAPSAPEPKVCDACADSMNQCGQPNRVPACCWDDSSTTKPCPSCAPSSEKPAQTEKPI